MSNGNNKAFLRNPSRFAGRHMMLVGHGLRSTGVAGGATSADLTAKGHYLSVSKGVRVVGCNIKPTENRDRDTMAAGTVDVEFRDTAARRERDFSAYFLPWVADEVVKIKLSDPRAAADDDVKIFFTAAVDGCSVFVEGDPRNPTVYHANAMSHNPGGLNPKVAAEMINLRRAREQQMKARLLHARGTKDRFDPGTGGSRSYDQTAGNMRVAEMEDYAPSGFGPISNADKVRILGSIPRVKTSRIATGTGTNRLGETVDLAPQINFNGTVFGFKNRGGTWEFYYQRRAQVMYRLPKAGGDVSKSSGWDVIYYWLPTDTHKFWPGGSGSAVARPMTVVAWPG